MKNFNGKAIYTPNGKAGEYSRYACNFYVGCSNGCTYCYCKKGILAPVMGQDKPQLKKCFKNESDALDVFKKELKANLPELQEHGLFFSFTTDPMLPETIDLTWDAVGHSIYNSVPVKILTKCTDWVSDFIIDSRPIRRQDFEDNSMYAFGFTLTGHDELEPNASTNAERIEAMAKLHDAGFKTFASIEPIIDFESSLAMIYKTCGFCDLYKIGLESGKKYDKEDLRLFLLACVAGAIPNNNKIYFKDSILNAINWNRDELKKFKGCVDSDYNLFNI